MSYLTRNAKRAKAHTPDTPQWQVDRDTERGPCLAHGGHLGAPGSVDRRFTTIKVLQAFCEVNNHTLEYANHYGEPGHIAPAKCILFANWNDISQKLQDRLESQGFELEWSDEWYVDTDADRAYRTEPSHMWWESRVRYTDGDVLTPDSDAQEWIDDAIGDLSRPLPSWFKDSELILRGFDMMPDTTNDSIAPALVKEGYDVILKRGSSSVFLEVWTRREAKRELFLSDSRGVYIPRDFAQSVDRTRVTGVSDEDYEALKSGPDNEVYWDVWTDVLDKARITASDSAVYGLEQDGDCWLVEMDSEYCEHEDKYYVHKEASK